MECAYCGRLCETKRSKSSHERLCKENPNRKDSAFVSYNKTREPTNQFIKAAKEGRVVSVSDETRKKLSATLTGRHISIEHRYKLSGAAIKNGFGGVRQSKKIDYNGIKLGSSYELEVAIGLDEFNVKWYQPKRLNYIDCTGKNRTYTADFYLPEYDVYLDPKNDFLINNINPRLGFKDVDKISWVSEQNNVTIIILNKHELTWPIIRNKIAGITQMVEL